MPISDTQKTAIEEVITALENVTQGGSFPDYYDVIPNPRCINGVKDGLQKGSYRDCLDVYEDLNAIFLNAQHYNEEGSSIYTDAEKLRYILDTEWRARQTLPSPPEPPQEEKAAPVTRAVTSKSQAAASPTHASSKPAPIASPRVTPPSSLRTVAPRPRSPSPEIDVDGERGTPEPEAGAEEEARDEDSHAIVTQLEKGVPRWQGLEDIGFKDELSEEQFLELVTVLKMQKDPSTSARLATALESIPEDARIAELPFIPDLSLKVIEAKVRAKEFETSAAFDKTMMQLFLKGRRYYEPGSEQYGRVCLLQRLYQALTSGTPPSGPPYVSSSNFSSVRAGPGTARPLYGPGSESTSSAQDNIPGVTMFRVSSKDRTFVEELQYKGWSFRLGDWVHLSNPDDPSRPIIGQVFRCFVSDEPAIKGKPGLTVCWYYRPEQTVHPVHRLFWENEVFKTSHFADHTLDDVIERIALQFTARHIRGRPRPPYWYPGWPLYVCDSRYNDRERCFVKIKNWSSCVPEEVRKRKDWMPIYPFERLVYPRRFPSPFVKGRGIKGPGGIGDSVERSEGEKIEGGGTGRKRARKGGSGSSTVTDTYGPSKGLYVGSAQYAPQNTQPAASPSTQYQYSQQSNAPPQPHYPQYGQVQPVEDRSIVQAAGGVAIAGTPDFKKLPPEIVKFFDRHGQTNEVLWFSAPPVNVSQDPGPQHSLAYLHFLARKRKETAEREMEIDPKRPRVEMPRTFTEEAYQLLANAPMDI